MLSHNMDQRHTTVWEHFTIIISLIEVLPLLPSFIVRRYEMRFQLSFCIYISCARFEGSNSMEKESKKIPVTKVTDPTKYFAWKHIKVMTNIRSAGFWSFSMVLVNTISLSQTYLFVYSQFEYLNNQCTLSVSKGALITLVVELILPISWEINGL